MLLNQPDIETLAIINEQLGRIQNYDKIKRANESLALLVQNNMDFEYHETFMEFINNKIRTPLYELYTSEEIVNLDKSTKNALFNSLMLITIFWPLNRECCVTKADLSHEQRPACFLSGHVADRMALAREWEKDQSYLHPIFKKRVSTREVLLNYPGVDVDTNKFNSITPPNLIEKITKETTIPLSISLLISIIGLATGSFAAFLFLSLIPPAFGLAPVVFLLAFLGCVGGGLASLVYVSNFSFAVLKNLYLNWAIDSNYQEEKSFNDKLKTAMDRITCQKIEARNNAFFSLYKSTNELRERTAINNPQSTSATPSIIPSSDTQSTASSSPSNNWNLVGLHATRKKSSDKLTVVSAEIQSQQTNTGQRPQG